MIVYANHADKPWDQKRGWLIDSAIEPHEDHVYHIIQIDEDRYSGCYSGSPFTAWLGIRPTDIDAGDGDCEEFWDKHRETALFGAGRTAQEAFRDLLQKAETASITIVEPDDPEWSNLKVVMVQTYKDGMKAMLFRSPEFQAWEAEG